MARIKVWDPLVRMFHWALVGTFAANALIVDDESKLHLWIGYTIVALVAVRIVWGFVGSRYARFSSFPPSLSDSVGQVADIATGRPRAHMGHTPLGALMIYNMLFALLLIGLSGYLMTTDAFWGVEWPETLHEVAVTWAEVSILVHVAGVIFETRRTRINLPRAMLTGYKDVPAE